MILIEAFQKGREKGGPRGRVLCKLERREARGRFWEGAELSVCVAGNMNEDDDFGDLYADVGPAVGGESGNSLYGAASAATTKEKGESRVLYEDDEDDEELLYGTSSSAVVSAPVVSPSISAAAVQGSGLLVQPTATAAVGFEVGARDVDNEENFLYGQLYGSSSSSKAPLQSTPVGLEQKPRPEAAAAAAGVDAADCRKKDPGGGGKAQVEKNGNSYLFGVADASSGQQAVFLPKAELSTPPPAAVVAFERSENPRYLPDTVTNVGLEAAQGGSQSFMPLGSVGGFDDDYETTAVGMTDGGNGNASSTIIPPTSADEGRDDWDSDSEDDIQIVLNDETPAYDNINMMEYGGEGELYEGSDDEDEEDLVIVAGDELLDGQEDWGEEGPLSEQPLPLPPNGAPPVGTEKAELGS